MATVHHSLHAALRDLVAHPSIPLPSPPNVPKRASVAVVIRVQPHPSYPPPTPTPSVPAPSLDDFFSLPWVQTGEIEVLFIKRASRIGDRWTSHVAFPGGKRDPTDDSDLAAAVRECYEEVGVSIDLDNDDVLFGGRLADRMLATSWGTVPLMVLCPFIFVFTSPDVPGMRLQPEEVASAHWVPMRLLLDRRFTTVERTDVSERLAQRKSWVVRKALRACLGLMEFSAIRLWPSVSVFSTFGRDYLEGVEQGKWENELVLWGVTLAVVMDLLELMEPGTLEPGALGRWAWPTFTAPDVRIMVAFLTRHVRAENHKKVRIAREGEIAAKAEGAESVEASLILVDSEEKVTMERHRESSIMLLIDGYYDYVRQAVWITMAGRAVVGAALMGVVGLKLLRR